MTVALTWWGHSSATVELGAVRVSLDPVLTDRLVHLRRRGESPGPEASLADVVLISHQHGDHLHVPSLRKFGRDVPIVGPPGAEKLLARTRASDVRILSPGDETDVAGVRIVALPASHPGRRNNFARAPGEAIGFRIEGHGTSIWYPGDTGLRDDMADVAPVDLGLVPIGGWGPTLPITHLSPEAGAEAVRRVGARWAVPVHWGTFWPMGLERLAPANHDRLFVTPGGRFVDSLDQPGDPDPVLAPQARRIVLG